MKRFTYFTVLILTVIVISTSCGSKDRPGKIYAPDMTYSRAYETYAERDSMKFTSNGLRKGGTAIYYDARPVAGTIKRNELFPYTLPNDSIGYKMSATVKNPLTDSLTAMEMFEAGRLFNVNCAICHGDKGNGNGPLGVSGKIGGIANLTLPNYVTMADGTMFHVMTYGKNLMGSYASQLDRKERWMIVKYIRTLQPSAAKTDSTKAQADSSIVKKA